MPKKDSLDKRRPEPPPYKDGDYATRYNNVSSFRTVTFDEGAFMYVWDWLARNAVNVGRLAGAEELKSVSARALESMEAQAQDFIPVDVPAPKSERGGSGKKVRCPDCGTKGPKKVKKNDRPMWKCEECGRRWPRDVPGEAPQEPSKASAAESEGSDASERPRKRQKPAKKKQKKAKQKKSA